MESALHSSADCAHPLGVLRGTERTPLAPRHVPLGESQKVAATVDQLIDEMSQRLAAAGFDPPGTNIGAWYRLARIVEIDPTGLALAEICEQALVWMDREMLRKRIAQRGSRTSTGQAEVKKCWGFPGSREWENWGVGLDVDGIWHLFHFNRMQGGWNRHNHVALTIPSGIPHELASRFVRNAGTLSFDEAHAVWKQHAKLARHHGQVLRALKPPLSRLRRAIRLAVEKEGHQPDGMPVSALNDSRWQARLKFGYARRREGRRVVEFTCRY